MVLLIGMRDAMMLCPAAVSRLFQLFSLKLPFNKLLSRLPSQKSFVLLVCGAIFSYLVLVFLQSGGSGVARNVNWGLVFFFPFFCAPFCPFSFFALLSFSLEVGLLKVQLGDLGERCELPQQGLERSTEIEFGAF